ncbi:MAG: 5-oxoprolinase subunit PxpB [Candidatus Methylomirabilaceae bacterium]
MALYPRVLAAGDPAVTVEFGETIDPEVNDRVLAFTRGVERLALSGVIETVPTYRSATVYFDPIPVDAGPLAERLQTLAETLPPPISQVRRTVRIPVVYGGELGPDLAEVAAFARLSVEKAMALHASVCYRVYMLGFTPGFPYMGPVPDALTMPRLAEPRARVPAGSVGIAGSQTGIYPIESPGGWRLIGRTPLRLYDKGRLQPFLLEAEDRVQFLPISREEYERIARSSERDAR